MNRETKVSSVSIIMCAIACLMSLNAVQAQQPGSSRFGAGTQYTVSTAGSSVPARGSGTSGSSTWEAGKGSFTSSAQPGGIWSDGSSFSASPGVAHSATQVLAPAASAPAFGAVRSGNSSGSKVKPAGGNTASGIRHQSSYRRIAGADWLVWTRRRQREISGIAWLNFKSGAASIDMETDTQFLPEERAGYRIDQYGCGSAAVASSVTPSCMQARSTDSWL